MTALKRYARLEAPGIWRPSSDDQRKDVIVSFGDTSLVISDKREIALSHWSLAAVVRVNKGERPALYTPSADGSELLEIDDDTMIEAIETVRGAILKGRPRPGRLRAAILAGTLAAVLALAFLWLPGVLVRHTVSVLPDPKRAEIGEDLLDAIGRVSGKPCRTARGERALTRLRTRLSPDSAGHLRVLRQGIASTVALPGGDVLLNRGLVEDHEGPDVVAGYLLAEAQRTAETDPLAPLLRAAGLLPTIRLLTRGQLPEDVIQAYAETLMTAQPAPVSEAALLERFAQAEVPSSPYGYALDVTGETTLGLIEADPMRGRTARPVLPDGDWVSLQEICGS